MVEKDNDRIQLTVTGGGEWATGGLNVTGECVGFTVVNPTYAAGDRTTGDRRPHLLQ
ncbi:MAG: hypothetical protein ACRCZS_07275 [Chroococcidiopsis sp.]